MKKVDKYKLRDALEQALFLISQEEQLNFNWDEAPVICEINGYRWLFGQEADEKINWEEAVEWCELVGGELPPRDILLQCFMNEDIKSEFKTEWYWSSTAFNASHAWGQSFYNGTQDFTNKSIYNSVRAVKKVKI